MALIGVRQSARLAVGSSFISIAACAIGHSAVAASISPSSLRTVATRQQQPALVAQATPPEDSGAPNEPEREIEFTSPTFSIGVQGEGSQGEGTQADGEAQGDPAQGTGTQQPLEAGAQQDAPAADNAASEADNEALAAQHDWVEFSVEDSDEAIARYGCDDLYCINALREQRGLPPLQLVWDAQNSANPQ